MSTRPKQHHYVTRSYLAGFLDNQETQLHCYGRHRDRAFRQVPQELATQRHYYSFKNTDGTWDTRLEALISEKIEDPGLAVLEALKSGPSVLKWEQRNALSVLAASQLFRVPHLRELLDNSHQAMLKHLLQDHERKSKEIGGDPGSLRLRSFGPFDDAPKPGDEGTLVSKSDLEAAVQRTSADPERFSRTSFLHLAFNFAKIFQRMKWTIYSTGGRERFITSDCPVITVYEVQNLEPFGLVRPDCEIRFPLCGTSLLSMKHDLLLVQRLNTLRGSRRGRRLFNRLPEIQSVRASDLDVQGFNRVQADYARRWVFSGSEQDWLIRHLGKPSANVGMRIEKRGDLFEFRAERGRA